MYFYTHWNVCLGFIEVHILFKIWNKEVQRLNGFHCLTPYLFSGTHLISTEVIFWGTATCNGTTYFPFVMKCRKSPMISFLSSLCKVFTIIKFNIIAEFCMLLPLIIQPSTFKLCSVEIFMYSTAVLQVILFVCISLLYFQSLF